ncbi:MAG: LysR family transcriptional regulator [Paracoccaceae bacterium]
MIDLLRQMAIFAKTIDHGSFRGAARELKLSPSVVSHHISQLEEHLGVALIYRSTRKLSLTADGSKLLAATQNMLASVEGELLRLSSTAAEPSGELRITLPAVLSQSHFVEAIADFSARYPRIQLSLDFSDTRRGLIDDHFDMAIRMMPKFKASPTSRRLFTVRRRLVAATSYLAANPAVHHPNDLLSLDWLSLAPVQHVPLSFSQTKKQAVRVKPDVHLSTNDAQSLYRLARTGAGLAVVPEFLAQHDVKAGVMEFVLPDWQLPSIDIFAEWPANAPKHGLIHLALNDFSKTYAKGAL